MLKLFYKAVSVGVLSGSLLLLDFSYKGIGIHSSFAESLKTEKINDGDLMSTLTMTAVGTLASRLYTYKMTTDIMLATAGGAIFIGGEVLAFLDLQSAIKEMEIQITRDKKGNINKEQIEALERLKKSYQTAKKTTERKKTLQMGAAAAFAAAGVTAYTMAGVETTQLAACTTAITATIAAASAAAAACSVGGCSAPHLACVKSATALSKSIVGYELTKQSIGPSAPLFGTFTTLNATVFAETGVTAGICAASGGATIAGICNSKLLTDVSDASGGTPVPMTPFIKPNPSLQKTMITKLFALVFPVADAALFSAMGIASSAAISFLLATSATLGPSIDMYMLNPKNRAIAWGVLAGFAYAATSATGNVISKIESNISKIDHILNEMYKMAAGATGTQTTLSRPPITTISRGGSNLEITPGDYSEVDLKGGLNGSLPCYTGKDPANCKSFDDSVKELPSFANLNTDSQAQLSNIFKAANGFNGTSKISSATLKEASTLSGNANALRATLEQRKKENAEILKAAKSNFNIDDQEKKLSQTIERGVASAIGKSKLSPSEMLASFYGGKITPTNTGLESPKKEEGEKNLAPKAIGGNVVNIGGGNSSLGKMDLGLSGTKEKETSPEELAKLDEAAKNAGVSMEDYEIKNDITKEKNSSLFELISNRYQRSGYPRLFKLKNKEKENIKN